MSSGCSGCVDRSRALATEQRQRRRATVRIGVALLVGAAGAAGLVVVLVLGGGTSLQGVLGGLALAGPAFALVTWTHNRRAGGVDIEERHAVLPGEQVDDGAGPSRRALLAGAVAAIASAAVAVVAARDSSAERALRRTSWRRGALLVTSDGAPVNVDDLAVGGLQTVWPEEGVGDADAQAVLIRIGPGRMTAAPGRETWSPEGYVAYSKLCTHMGCPVGLYQQDPDVLLCPCHQATFDVLDGGRAIHGPASRALPQLPLVIDDDGFLRADGDFPDAVGPGFWSRPS